MYSEMKVIREQKEETLRFKRLQKQKEDLLRNRYMVQIYHNEQNLEQLKKEIQAHETECETYNEDKKNFEADIKSAKKIHAKANKDVLLLEKSLKTQISKQQEIKPTILALKEKIRYGQVKLHTAENSLADINHSLMRQQQEVNRYDRELEDLNNAIEETATQNEQGVDLGEAQMREYMSLQSKVDQKMFKEKEELKIVKRQLTSVNDGMTQHNCSNLLS